MITLNCPHCNITLSAQDEWVGMQLQCPNCGNNILVQRNIPQLRLNKHGSPAQRQNDNHHSSSRITERIPFPYLIAIIAVATLVFIIFFAGLAAAIAKRPSARPSTSIAADVVDIQAYNEGRKAALSVGTNELYKSVKFMEKSPEQMKDYIKGYESVIKQDREGE